MAVSKRNLQKKVFQVTCMITCMMYISVCLLVGLRDFRGLNLFLTSWVLSGVSRGLQDSITQHTCIVSLCKTCSILWEIYRTVSYLSLGSLDHIIPQNQNIAVPQPNANITNLIRVVGAWKEATPTKERTLQNAKPCMVPENCSSMLIPVNIGDRMVITNAS